MTKSESLPTILLFNINGNGLGHMSRCLAYARRLRDRARPVFFSNAAAIELINEMGFEADYLVSPFSSRASGWDWNRQLVERFGLMLERVRPDAIVFDGSWPFQGMLDAVTAYAEHYPRPTLVWSRRGLHKADTIDVPVAETLFDLVIEPGEIGAEHVIARADRQGRKVIVPPVTLLDDDELLDRGAARAALGLEPDGRYALFSLGPGNLKDISGIGQSLTADLERRGFTPVWACAPISVRDVELPAHTIPLRVYPLPRYLRGFDVFVGAAGYNTCCEVLQAGIPSLLVPNTQVIDDQGRRAALVAERMPAVISACETAEPRAAAVERLLTLAGAVSAPAAGLKLDGARLAAAEILALVTGRASS